MMMIMMMVMKMTMMKMDYDDCNFLIWTE